MIPELVAKLHALGIQVVIESGTGLAANFSDQEYLNAGASIEENHQTGLANADIIFRLSKPDKADIEHLKSGCLHISFLDPFNESETLKALAAKGVNAVSMEMMPRTTLAQKMDAISSQANLAGYSAVIHAAARMSKILPMMMTPSGTISPAKVFIVGVGVAGLQAIATAKRLGARVDAFDTRPVVEEQVKSLGAKFVKINLGDTGQTDQGYAKELTPEQIQMQRDGMAKVCASSDIVITTAKLFGRKAPIIITREMVAGMKPGSVIVDLAALSGGNVEGTVAGKESITENGVIIMGHGCFEIEVATNASQMYANNTTNFLEHFWDKETKNFDYRLEDEILRGCLLSHQGHIIHERFKA